MNARVQPGTKLPFVKAFGGYEFVHGMWRAVPAGFEEAAQAHPLLEVQEDEVMEVVSPSSSEESPIVAPAEGTEEEKADEDAGTPLQRSGSRRQRSSDR